MKVRIIQKSKMMFKTGNCIKIKKIEHNWFPLLVIINLYLSFNFRECMNFAHDRRK